MFSFVKNASTRVKICPFNKLNELIRVKSYSCLLAAGSIKNKGHPSFHQNNRCSVGQDVYYVRGSDIRFSTKVENKTLVYRGLLTPQIRVVKIFSLSSSVLGLASQPILYNHASELGGTGVVVAVATFIGFFTFVTPILIHLLTRKYVTDLHYNEATGVFTASLLTFFLRKKQVSFKTEDVTVPDVPGPFTSFIVKNTGLFVDPRQFEDPSYYGKLMGYDKPLDFLLKKEPLTNTDTENSKRRM